ncbi:MAG: hypothetical protein U0795_07705 [Pirellulales bacterium]
MAWELSGWELGLVCGLAALTGSSLAALAARQSRLAPKPVPKHPAGGRIAQDDADSADAANRRSSAD